MYLLYMGLDVRKSVFGICNMAMPNKARSVTESSLNTKSLHLVSLAEIICRLLITKALDAMNG